MTSHHKIRNITFQIIIFVLVALISFGGFYQVRSTSIEEREVMLTGMANAYLSSQLDSISVGYFQWDEMRDLIYTADRDGYLYYFDELKESYELIDGIGLVYGFNHFQDLYQLTHNEVASRAIFTIFDDDVTMPLLNVHVVMTLNTEVVADELGLGSKYKLSPMDGSLQVKEATPRVNLGHVISSFSIALLALLLYQVVYTFSVRQHYEIEGLDSIIMLLSRKDQYTADHSREVADLAVKMAKNLGLSRKNQRTLYKAGHLHDIGKIGIPDEILNKTGKLSPEEYELMKEHPTIGYEIVSHFPNLKEVAQLVRVHHEMADGSGYPMGLKKDKLPCCAEILTLADIYSALTTDRPYRKAYAKDEALEILGQMAFSPQMISCLREVL